MDSVFSHAKAQRRKEGWTGFKQVNAMNEVNGFVQEPVASIGFTDGPATHSLSFTAFTCFSLLSPQTALGMRGGIKIVAGKSRRDATLITVGFNPRVDAATSPKPRRGGT